MSLPALLMLLGTSDARFCCSLTVFWIEPVGPLPSLLLAQPVSRSAAAAATDMNPAARRRDNNGHLLKPANADTLAMPGPRGHPRDPTVTRRRRLRQGHLRLAQDNDTAVGYVVARPIQFRLESDMRTFRHDDVLVQDCLADHCAAADLHAVHEHRPLDVRAGGEPDVGGKDALPHRRAGDDGTGAHHRFLCDA